MTAAMKSGCFVTPWMLLTVSALTGCCGHGKPDRVLPDDFAPKSIVLPANRPVMTRDGQWTPKTDTIWHSHSEYVEMQERLMDALDALTKK